VISGAWFKQEDSISSVIANKIITRTIPEQPRSHLCWHQREPRDSDTFLMLNESHSEPSCLETAT
ncbi:hypothetical protein OA162_03260, partial [Synechococcus sp. AH-736-A19]|nr:hypothetical protein [Synechococcus sp. AH-736-A19]